MPVPQVVEKFWKSRGSCSAIVYKDVTTLGRAKEFDAQIQVFDISNEIKVGYSLIGFARCGRSVCSVAKLKWNMGKDACGHKLEFVNIACVLVNAFFYFCCVYLLLLQSGRIIVCFM